jgi:hypothetical protein
LVLKTPFRQILPKDILNGFLFLIPLREIKKRKPFDILFFGIRPAKYILRH